MDNAIVGATGALCFVLAQTSTNWIESVTPLSIVAIVVYYFLWKFDRKLDVIEDTTRKLLEEEQNKKKLIQELEELNGNNHADNN